MSAPAEAGGGRQSKASGESKPAKVEAERPPRGRSPSASTLPKPPQGHGGYGRRLEREPPRRRGVPPRYTNQNTRQRMLEAAVEVAGRRGYESMRIFEITDPIGLTHQAFYAHFRDKRHCMCEAIDPKLGAIERMAASLGEADPDSAAKIAHALDDVIAERFGSQEGTRGRLVSAMIELLREHGSFHKVRIGALVKAAHVPPGDFYRQFSGKVECFAVAYERLLGELVSEVRECPAEHTRHDLPALLAALAGALDSDPERRHILIVLMAHLPDEAPEGIDGARKGALREAIAAVLARAGGIEAGAADAALGFAAASVVEVIRTAELADDPKSLQPRLLDLATSLSRTPAAGPGAERSAAVERTAAAEREDLVA